MPVPAGTRFGHYETISPLGAGGMGEVYRARDTRLKRDVALKVLPPAFSADPERMARFQREAEVLASLNHSNIAAIYGVEEQALAMELVEGEAPKGPLQFEEAWKLASQIAAALEYAHERGIVHRDLKPANILVTQDGVVKLLDFGLAKAFGDPIAASSNNLANSPTLTIGATVAGTILGTAAYMAPEQAKGKRVDKRADVWAFGAVLYELLTGDRLFKGEDAVDTLAQVLTKEPDLSRVPAIARPLLAECLKKDPSQRLRDLGDAKLFLNRDREGADQRQSTPSRSWFSWSIAGIALALAAGVSFFHFRETPPVEKSIRFEIQPPDRSGIGAFRLSPDGRRIAFLNQSKVWVRDLDTLESKELSGTEGATYPFWSPDSESIGFFSQGKLKRMAFSGGPAQTLCDVASGRGATWNKDGVILFSPGPTGKIFRVAAAGGLPVAVTRFQESAPNQGHRFPEFLPDGQHFLFQAQSDKAGESGLFVGAMDGTIARLLPDVSNAMFSPAEPGSSLGHVLFRRTDTLMAQLFDSGQRKVTGDAVPVAERIGIALNSNAGYGDFSVAPDGTLAFGSGEAGNFQLELLDRGGKRIRVISESAPGVVPKVSPDGAKVAYTTGSGAASTIWIQDVAGGSASRFTFTPVRNQGTVWSPDGARIAFSVQPQSTYSADFFLKPSNGAGKEELLLRAGVNGNVTDWSPDGNTLAYQVDGPSTDLWLLPLGGTRKPVVFLQTPFNERFGRFSPDGKLLAYDSNESSRNEIYVQPVPPNGSKWQVSKLGGISPHWRRDGKELFYFAPDRKLMAVPVQTNGVFTAGVPQVLFEVATQNYSPMPDGQRFVVAVPADGVGAQARPLTVVTHWQSMLRK